MLFWNSVSLFFASSMSTSDHLIEGPFSVLSELFMPLRICGGRVDVDLVVDSIGLSVVDVDVVEATSFALVTFPIDWFTLELLLSGATFFSLIVDSDDTKMKQMQNSQKHVYKQTFTCILLRKEKKCK